MRACVVHACVFELSKGRRLQHWVMVAKLKNPLGRVPGVEEQKRGALSMKHEDSSLLFQLGFALWKRDKANFGEHKREKRTEAESPKTSMPSRALEVTAIHVSAHLHTKLER